MLGIEGQVEGCGNVYMGFPEQLLITREHKGSTSRNNRDIVVIIDCSVTKVLRLLLGYILPESPIGFVRGYSPVLFRVLGEPLPTW